MNPVKIQHNIFHLALFIDPKKISSSNIKTYFVPILVLDNRTKFREETQADFLGMKFLSFR